MNKKEEFLKYFLVGNKSGYKTKENHVKKHKPELYKEVMGHVSNNNIDDETSFKEKLHLYLHDLPEIPKCLNCGGKLKFGRALSEPYRTYCSMKCTNKHQKHKDSVKKTIDEKYGGALLNNEEIRKKAENTTLRNYGVKNIFHDTDYIKKSNLKKLGVDNPNKLDSVKEKKRLTNLNKYGVETPILLRSSRDVNHEKSLEDFLVKYKDLDIVNYKGDYVDIKCSECKEEYNIYRSTLYYRFENNVNPCTLCNPIFEYNSIKEKELKEFISSLGVDFIENDRDVLNGKELDIYIPSYKIAIEFNGLYYHSDKFVNKGYHLNKTIECEERGIQLIQIFEDEWVYKKEIVLSMIKNLLNKNTNRIYGRRTRIKNVNTKDKTKFLNDNHIQGSVGSMINLGLYHNDELVSIMTFGKKRLVMGSKTSSEGEYELLRFCNKLNTSVIGGASKLFKHFMNNYSPKTILSFADRRWSIGNLYEILGFKFIYDTTPNYTYVNNRKREHRFKHRKSELVRLGFDEKMSEREIMKMRGYHRIYDCGNKKYLLSI